MLGSDCSETFCDMTVHYSVNKIGHSKTGYSINDGLDFMPHKPVLESKQVPTADTVIVQTPLFREVEKGMQTRKYRVQIPNNELFSNSSVASLFTFSLL